MESTCAICFEEMDMETYQDERESTETCFKLECGHAFHTKCIVSCLQKSDHVCPQCNKHKTLEGRLSLDGLAHNLFLELKKHPDVKLALREVKEAKQEMSSSMEVLRKETVEFVNKRKQELCISEKRKYLVDSIANAKAVVKTTAREYPPKYSGCVNIFTTWRLEKLIFGTESYRYMYRLRYPRIYVPIK